VIIADVNDEKSLRDMAGSTDVVLNAAGPVRDAWTTRFFLLSLTYCEL
jgi:hypothetical protein